MNIPYNRYGLPASLVQYLPRNHKIIFVDIGAHEGHFTKMLQGYCGISQGLLVEAIPEKAERLKNNFLPPIFTVFECAASSSTGITEFEINEAQATSSMLRIRRDMPELSSISLGDPTIIQCKTMSLDDMAKKTAIQEINLLKIDVQGAEHLVLQGASEIIRNTSMVWTETSLKRLYTMSSDFISLYNQFYSLGFKLMELEPGFRGPDRELLQCDALFINERILK